MEPLRSDVINEMSASQWREAREEIFRMELIKV